MKIDLPEAKTLTVRIGEMEVTIEPVRFCNRDVAHIYFSRAACVCVGGACNEPLLQNFNGHLVIVREHPPNEKELSVKLSEARRVCVVVAGGQFFASTDG